MTQFNLKWGRFSLELGRRTCVMGILNTTPDSFSDGGKYISFEAAVEHGLQLVADGADILDIGGESSRPFSEPVSVNEELDRVIPVIEKLSSCIDIPISIDTVKAEVAKEALKAGASIINDITALERDSNMVHVAAEYKVPVILMHMKGTPETMQINPQYDDFMGELTEYLEQRARFAISNGVAKDLVILDPGIGFGKTLSHNLIIIQHLEKIAALGYPLLLGPSRKTFVRTILVKNLEKRGVAAGRSEVNPLSPVTETGTMAAVAASIMRGSHIVRVHDVASARAVADIIDAVNNVDMA